MVRVILGSLAGFLTTAVVVVLLTFAAATALGVEQGQTSAVYLAINLVGSFAAAVGGGYLAQWISRHEKIIAPAVMATLMFLLTIGSVFGEPALVPQGNLKYSLQSTSGVPAETNACQSSAICCVGSQPEASSISLRTTGLRDSPPAWDRSAPVNF